MDSLNYMLEHLHSNMFLLKYILRACYLLVLIIYIPICFYLNDHVISKVLYHVFIYIPICFYLNGNSYLWLLVQNKIYIPICFYLNCRCSRHSILRNCIYIPICFYLNRRSCLVIWFLCIHLHSNMFLLKFCSFVMPDAPPVLFTFQYVST